MALTTPSINDTPGLDHLVRARSVAGQLTHLQHLPARPARFADLAHPLPRAVADRLPVERFYVHQARAIDHLRAGRSVAVATGTASGKSLCYQVPIAEAVVQPVRSGTSLLLFPTKALAQDQLRALGSWDVPGLVAATYDGDTPPEQRTWVRERANVLLTNPEMLHHGILPHHARWATFLMRLRYVVVDELHLLRGIFGTHVAHLLRRLRRLCAHYGSDPTFVFCSATIGEPHRLASELCGKPVVGVDDDGSPRGPRHVALWDPQGGAGPHLHVVGDPLDPAHEPDEHDEGGEGRRRSANHPAPHEHDEGGEGRRRSANAETAGLVAALVGAGHRTLAFCRSRKGAELVADQVRRRLGDADARLVRAYRGGYLAEERRAIEAELFGGHLRGVVATTALELGIDVGGLDACVLNGFPGTIASMWQQLGRSGRAGQPSLGVLVAGDDQLDRWLLTHPHEVFERPPEPAVVNLANPFVLHPHLACAAYELPLSWDDDRWWPGLLDDGVRHLVGTDALRVRRRRPTDPPRGFWAGGGWPAHGIGLRSSSSDEVAIVTGDGTLVGTVDAGRATRQVHPGAVYLHQGRPWRVHHLDLDDHVAVVDPDDGREYTQPRVETEFSVIATEARRAVGRAEVSLGRVVVRSQVTGYRRFSVDNGKLLGAEELDLPPGELPTRACWTTIAVAHLVAAGLDPTQVPGALHAAEHAAIGILPLFTICDRWDVGGVSTPLQADTGLPTIMIYDGYAGGAGIAELAYDAADRHWTATLELIAACPCTGGCPSCVQSPKCGNGNEPLDKAAAQALLAHVLAGVPGVEHLAPRLAPTA